MRLLVEVDADVRCAERRRTGKVRQRAGPDDKRGPGLPRKSGTRNAGTSGKLVPAFTRLRLNNMTVLTSMEYPHWLMIAGTLLLLLGVMGLALRKRSVGPELDPPRDDELSDPEADLTPAEAYHRTAKEKRRARWAETPSEELLDADPKTKHPT